MQYIVQILFEAGGDFATQAMKNTVNMMKIEKVFPKRQCSHKS